MSEQQKISRRTFMRLGSLAGGGLLLSFMIPPRQRQPATPGEAPFAPNAFLEIYPDNSVKVLLAHSEMGQGIWTSLPMIIADELDADWQSIRVEHAAAAPAYKHTLFGLQITGGSSTTFSEFDRYRTAGATARWLFVAAAAQRWGVAMEDCTTDRGYVVSGDQRMAYGDLLKEAAQLTPPAAVKLLDPGKWKYIGKSTKRLDGLEKVNGRAVFGMDIQGEGLLIAVVAHAPVIGARLVGYDDTAARGVQDVVKIVAISTGVAVIARNYYAANKAKKLLRISWDSAANASLSTDVIIGQYRKLVSRNGLPSLQKSAVRRLPALERTSLRAEYVFPYLAHAPMEPLNCTVKISGDQQRCEIWTGTQMPMNEQAAAARVLGIPPEAVQVHTPFLGGGFGRRATPSSDWVSEAAEVAKVSGCYIKMIWAREDDIKGQHYRPLFVHRVEAAIDRTGKPVSWHHNIAGQSIYEENGFLNLVKDGVDESSVEGISDSAYMDHIDQVWVGVHPTKVPVTILWWRSVGHTHTAFVMETMIDRMAHAAGRDPVEYRRALLQHSPRHLHVLNLAAAKAGWGSPLPAGRYRGVAVHASFRSYVAEIVEISMTGPREFVVHKVTCAIDCGLHINPENIKAQMESCILFGLTMAKYGEITITDGQVDQNNFYDYRVARMNETPVMDIHLVPYEGQALGGVGEAGVPPLAPALANALYAATGERIDRLPFFTGTK